MIYRARRILYRQVYHIVYQRIVVYPNPFRFGYTDACSDQIFRIITASDYQIRGNDCAIGNFTMNTVPGIVSYLIINYKASGRLYVQPDTISIIVFYQVILNYTIPTF